MVSASLQELAAACLRPPPDYKVSEWAAEFRYLAEEVSAAPGKWYNERTPYLVGPMDALSPSDPHERVVFMGPAQCGKTELANNWLGFIIDRAPGPVMVVQPTESNAKRWAVQRFDKMVRSTPVLQPLVSIKKSRDSENNMTTKGYRGGVVIIGNAKSAVSLRQMPVRFLMLDDVDGYDPDVDGEGDPVDLAMERTNTFRGLRKIGLFSTPTDKDTSRIDLAYQESDRRKFYVPCPHCGEYQELGWGFGADEPGGVKWPKGNPTAASYQCRHCEALIPEHRKLWMLQRGEWRATAPGDGVTAGFHLSGVYSPWVTWAEAARRFLAVRKDPSRLRVFVNTYLAQTWDDKDGDKVPREGLMSRLETWKRLPPGVVILTAGVDVQADRLELEVVGWGLGEESWSVDYRTIWGDPSVPPGHGVWAALTEVLQGEAWDHPLVPGGLRISAACLDTGGDNTLAAYRYVKRWSHLRNGRGFPWGIKGIGGQGRKLWPQKPSKRNKGKIRLYMLGVDSGKETVYARLRVDEPGPGFCHFPVGRDADYFAGLTSEVRRTRYHHGRAVRYWWLREGTRNEPLDCRVYALAALHGWYAGGNTLKAVLDRRGGGLDDTRRTPAPQPAKVASGGGGDWFGSAGRWL